MGLVSGIIRLQTLQQMQLDLEDKIQTLTKTKMELSSQGNDLLEVCSDLDIDSPELRHIEARRKKLELMERKIDAEMQKYQNTLKMIESETSSAQKIVDNSIKRSFSYGGGQ